MILLWFADMSFNFLNTNIFKPFRQKMESKRSHCCKTILISPLWSLTTHMPNKDGRWLR
ncbi:hypothetical protein OH492_24770 [Vibrio chagasii]|nr:hypothetical protein [Vibrio chagasii]